MAYLLGRPPREVAGNALLHSSTLSRPMALYLSAADVERLRNTLAVLAAPLEHSCSADWRRAVCHRLETLLPGSRACFFLAQDGETMWAGDDDAASVLNGAWPPPAWSYDAVRSRVSVKPQVVDWTELYDVAQVKRTPFYEEIVRPYHLWAPLTLFTLPLGGAFPALLGIYSNNERAALPLLERRRAVMGLLASTFSAGVSSLTHLANCRADLIAAIEQLRIGVGVCGVGGRLIHENAALSERLLVDEDRARIRSAIEHCACAASALNKRPSLKSAPDVLERRHLTCEVQTRTGSYRITATSLLSLWPDTAVAAAVLVDCASATRPDAAALVDAIGLTPREAEVAQLLRRGQATREIAARLGITINTARRHLEHILGKLDAHSRAEAVARLSEGVGNVSNRSALA